MSTARVEGREGTDLSVDLEMILNLGLECEISPKPHEECELFPSLPHCSEVGVYFVEIPCNAHGTRSIACQAVGEWMLAYMASPAYCPSCAKRAGSCWRVMPC